jgi:hypothetical protein
MFTRLEAWVVFVTVVVFSIDMLILILKNTDPKRLVNPTIRYVVAWFSFLGLLGILWEKGLPFLSVILSVLYLFTVYARIKK